MKSVMEQLVDEMWLQVKKDTSVALHVRGQVTGVVRQHVSDRVFFNCTMPVRDEFEDLHR